MEIIGNDNSKAC